MKRIILTLLAVSLLATLSAQTAKCGIDTKALVREEVAAGAKTISFLVKVVPDFDRAAFEKAGVVIGAQGGPIVTMRVPVESLGLLDSSKDVVQYSISHRVGGMYCDKARADTRADSVQNGLGTIDGIHIDGEGVLIGITDWGFDYSHPNYNGQTSSNWRMERAWDHFKKSGPAPAGYNYGTETIGAYELADAHGDTSNLYGYGTHGTHVAGIAAGRGKSGKYRGMAPKARLLFCSFGLGEAEWIDAVDWMYRVAKEEGKRLVINSSWGMYSFSTLDGTSLLSQHINSLSDSGIVFCTSAGNNGDALFHVSKTFVDTVADTLRTIVKAASEIYVIQETGQALIMWGEVGQDFEATVRIKNGNNIWTAPFYSTANDTVIYDTMICGEDTVKWRVMMEHSNLWDNRPHMQLDLDKTPLEKQLLITAESGTVHAWNVANKENHAGNEGCYFISDSRESFTAGDNNYGIGEPACAEKCISVAAHMSDSWNVTTHECRTGDHASFTSYGPLINGEQKPEISAPGQSIISSISVWSDDSRNTASESMMDLTVNGHTYRWAAMSGTSMSCPVVTGITALILQANPDLSVNDIRHIITSTARNDDKTGPLVANDSADVRWGWGKIDALRAVNAAMDYVSIQQAEKYRLPLHVYPNPTTGKLTINTGCGEKQTAEILSIDGRKVMEMPVTLESSIDVSGLPKGVYILRVGSRTEKVIVK
jgi:subtilisin family serine protease